MKRTALIGWQTLLADLSLILFMVTAAAMANPDRKVKPAAAKLSVAAVMKNPSDSTFGEPMALWRAGGSQTLRQWLDAQQPDDRQQLTITAHYRKGGAARALAVAQTLLGETGGMGRDARVIVTLAIDATGNETLASLAYDQAPRVIAENANMGLAQGLRVKTGHPPFRNQP